MQPRSLQRPPPAVKTRKQRQLCVSNAAQAGSAEAANDFDKRLSKLDTNQDREHFFHSLVSELNTYYEKEIHNEATWPVQPNGGSSFIRKN